MAATATLFTTLLSLALSFQADDAPLWNTFDQAGWELLQEHRYAEAEKTFRDAIARKPDAGHRMGRSKTGLAWALFFQGRHPEACRVAAQAERLTVDPVTAEQRIRRAECLHVLAKTMCNECKWTEGQKRLKEAQEILTEVGGQEERIAELITTSGEFFLWQFLPVEALQQFAIALPDTRDADRRATLVLNQTQANLMRGELVSAANTLALASDSRPSVFQQITQIEESRLDPDRRSWLALLRAELALMQGRFNDAAAFLANAEPCPVTIGGALRCLNQRHALAASIAVQRGEFHLARRHISSMTANMEWERPLIEAEQLEIHGEIAVAQGEFARAETCFRNAVIKKQASLDANDPRLINAWFGVATAHNYLKGLRQPVVDAHETIQRILVRMKSTLHPAFIMGMRVRAQHRLYHRDSLQALQLCAGAVEKLQGRISLSHPERSRVLEVKAIAHLTRARNRMQNLAAAAESIQQALEYRNASVNMGASPAHMGDTQLVYGWVLLAQKQRAAALKQFQAANESFKVANREHSLRGNALLGISVCKLPSPSQSELLQAKDQLRARLGPLATAHELALLGLIYRGVDCMEEAIFLTQLALEFYQEAHHPQGIKTMQDNIREFTAHEFSRDNR